MLSRIIHGARISLLVGVSAVIVSLAGRRHRWGWSAASSAGKVDTVIGTVVDVTLSFPQILLALAFVAALGPSLVTIIVVLGLTGWERYTRVVRAEVLALREKEFVEAARAIGVGPAAHHLPPRPAQHVLVDRGAVHAAGRAGHPGRRRRCRSSAWARAAPTRRGAR